MRKTATKPAHHLLREGLLILALAISIFLLLSLVTYHQNDPGWSHYASVSHVANAGGKAGAWIADFVFSICGYIAYLIPFILIYLAWVFYRYEKKEISSSQLPIVLARALGFVLIFSSASGLIGLFVQPIKQNLPFESGGILGTIVSTQMMRAFNSEGTILILIALLLIGITLFTELSWLRLIETLGSIFIRAGHFLFVKFKQIKLGNLFSFFNTFKMPQLWTKKEKSEPVIHAPPVFSSTMKTARTETVIAEPKIAEPEVRKIASKNDQTVARVANSHLAPKLSLLDSPQERKTSQINTEELEERSREVELRLADFGVEVRVVAVHPGPVVTRYELELAAGTKVSKISGLAKDLARSLSVISVRVVEVIPGKSVIGLELPNPNREVVSLQEVLASAQYQKASSSLTLALGKDIAGHAVIVDLAKMPHLLVAGTTGSGKSVCLNAILMSLLYKSSPKELRLILIDPKMLELAVYDDIPHLLAPVVTDMKDAATALRWCVAEMEKRYRLMASLGVRNVTGYNEKIKKARERGQPLLNPLQNKGEQEAQELFELPKIVVLADEFADMMVVVGKKVETLIARLAQKARAAGIHLILATQRPSVDVITGLIKANIPTRIAFQVSSKIDSRTILDQQGAEQLLGYGDMLYLPPGSGVPKRVHGAYVDDDEVHRVVAYLKEHGEPDYLDEVLDENAGVDLSGYTAAAMGENETSADEADPLYDEAVHFVTKLRKVSISSIQRRFKIGYNRAARIVETMEAAGVVSRMEANGNREVLAPPPIEQD